MTDKHQGQAFSTHDADYDTSLIATEHCAVKYHGAWWYGSCLHSNLNGRYYEGGTVGSLGDTVVWNHWKGFYYSLKETEMKTRPSN